MAFLVSTRSLNSPPSEHHVRWIQNERPAQVLARYKDHQVDGRWVEVKWAGKEKPSGGRPGAFLKSET